MLKFAGEWSTNIKPCVFILQQSIYVLLYSTHFQYCTIHCCCHFGGFAHNKSRSFFFGSVYLLSWTKYFSADWHMLVIRFFHVIFYSQIYKWNMPTIIYFRPKVNWIIDKFQSITLHLFDVLLNAYGKSPSTFNMKCLVYCMSDWSAFILNERVFINKTISISFHLLSVSLIINMNHCWLDWVQNGVEHLVYNLYTLRFSIVLIHSKAKAKHEGKW